MSVGKKKIMKNILAVILAVLLISTNVFAVNAGAQVPVRATLAQPLQNSVPAAMEKSVAYKAPDETIEEAKASLARLETQKNSITKKEYREQREAYIKKREEGYRALEEAMRTLIQQPLAELMEFETHTFKSQLDRALDEKRLPSFLKNDLFPYVAEHKNAPRIMVAFVGVHSSGKTTTTNSIANAIPANFPARRVRILTLDDFLEDKADRVPRTTKDPYRKVNVDWYKRFVRELRENRADRYVAKPLYDQAAKGRLKIGASTDGKFIIYNGSGITSSNRRVVIDIDRNDHTFSFREILYKAENEGMEEIDLTGKDGRGNVRPHKHITASGTFDCGDMRIDLAMAPDGALEVSIQREGALGAQYRIAKRADGVLVAERKSEKAGSRHRDVLQPGGWENAIDVLELWPPATPLHTGSGDFDGEVVVSEGFLSYASDAFDVYVEVKASFFVRIVRSVIRAMTRGQVSTILQKANHAAYVKDIQDNEDSKVYALIAQARHEYKGKEFFVINTMSFPELFNRNANVYNYMPPGNNEALQEIGIAVNAVMPKIDHRYEIGGGDSLDTAGLREWITELFSYYCKHAMALTVPNLLELKRTMPLEEQYDRFMSGDMMVLSLGEHLLMITGKPDDQTKRVTLSSDKEQEIKKLLYRTQQIGAGAQVLDLKNDDNHITIPAEILEKTESGIQKRIVTVFPQKILVVNQMPYLEERINSRSNGEANGNGDYEKKCRKLIRSFFEEQQELLLRGIIDTAPDMMRRYGLDRFSQREVVLGAFLETYRLDDDARTVFATIAKKQKQDSRGDYAGFSIKYVRRDGKDLYAALNKLKGYQRQYVYNCLSGEDYLERVPSKYRMQYVNLVRRYIPIDKYDLQRMQFGKAWQTMVGYLTDKTGSPDPHSFFNVYYNSGVTSFAILSRQTRYLERVYEQIRIDYAKTVFNKLFRHGAIVEGSPQLAWISLCLHSLPPDKDNYYYVFMDYLFKVLVRDKNYLQREVAGINDEAQLKNMVPLIVGSLKRQIAYQYEQRRAQVPIAFNWHEELIERCVFEAIVLPNTWEQFKDVLSKRENARKRTQQQEKQHAINPEEESLFVSYSRLPFDYEITALSAA